MLKAANSKLKLEHLVIEKGSFKQEKELPKTTLQAGIRYPPPECISWFRLELLLRILLDCWPQESDLLTILKPERDQEEELVQSAEISNENLMLLLDRSDMDLKITASADIKVLPMRGPGWEVVGQSGTSRNMLSAIEGYRKVSAKPEA